MGLSAYLNTRWARDGLSAEEAAHATLTPAHLWQITGRPQPHYGRRVLTRLADLVSIKVREDGDLTHISWPKWPEFQGIASRESPGSRPRAAPSVTPPPPPPQDAEEKTPRSRSGPAPRNDADPSRKPEPRRAPPAAWALRCAGTLGTLLRDVPGARLPRGWEARWARELEALAREAPDLADLPETEREARVDAAIRWVLGPENLGREFEVIVRSGRALREKWPRVVAAARRARRDSRDPDEFFERLKARLEEAHGPRAH